ncbi:di-copper centre-containing protein [Phanerochaete sordida]|uniref:tyrosinase n=1 Tax=Phanerochaete sordida TaxID=48140 RepID=A0A9P3LDL9_9APHY|nr:di-copper centre-containing protein [Phanerochaete sordida]
MSAENYLIVGRKGTGVHDRLEIEDLQTTQPEQFTLFILAFLALQDRGIPVDSPGLAIPPAAHFTEIAGIHGLPFKEWIGDLAKDQSNFSAKDPKDTQPVPSRFGGYCNHGSVVFPTWHRPYVMAVEQAIGNIAVELAKRITASITDKPDEVDAWKKAAQALRFPFWDWAAKKVADDGVPPVLTDDKVNIKFPGGITKEVENPLAFFPFKTIPDGFEDEVLDVKAYFSKWKRTFRYAKSTPHATSSGTADLNAKIKKKAESIRRHVGKLFTFDDDGKPPLVWDEFSNHTTQSLRTMDFYNCGSLEGIHDSMHDFIGGNGHMSDPDYAGFDPIFFLHHCNVDRLLALWEYVYPDYFMGSGYTHSGRTYPFTQSRGTYSLVYNAKLTDDSPLPPFRTEDSKYWTSTGTRFLDGKYYSYPEVAGVKVGRDIDNDARILARKRLQEYYGVFDDMPSRAPPGTKIHDIELPIFNSPEVVVPDHHKAVDNYRNFVVVVQTNEFAFNGPYTIDVYYDPVAKSHGRGQSENHVYIGTVAVFARPDHSDCKGCSMRRDAGSTVRGVIAIPLNIVDQVVESNGINRSNGNLDEVTTALKSHLHGFVVDRFGKKIGGAVGDPVKEEDALSNAIAPDLTLVSSAAAFSKGANGAETLKWFDWNNHGRVFDGGHRAWKRL